MPQQPSTIVFREAVRREALRRELRELASRYDVSAGRLGELQDEQEAVRQQLLEVRESAAHEEQRSAGRLSELRRLRQGLGYETYEPDPAAALYQAAIVAEVGRTVPDFSYYGPIKRWFARGVARVVLFLSGIVTTHQRQFNERLLRVVSSLAAHNEDLITARGRLQTEALEARLRGLEAGLAVWEATTELRQVSRSVNESVDGLAETVDQRLAALDERVTALASGPEEDRLAVEIERIRGTLAAAELLLQRLEEASEELSRGGRRRQQPAIDGVGDVLSGEVALDRLYAVFEERFRGTREDIRNRLGEYLPAVQETAAIRQDRPLVDLGCGRGEWLELLRDAGIPAYGVDRNQVFLHTCRDLGVRVVEGDVLEHLQLQADGALGAVTAFHIIEHLAPARMIEVLTECSRALAPGGLLILETPNPENLTVGAAKFYSDLSHVRPVYPETLVFLLQRLGFEEVGLHSPSVGRVPPPQIPQLDPGEPAAGTLNPAAEAINEHLRSPLDYAAFARRAR